MEIEITAENDPRDYVGYDLYGYPFNSKYPPNKEKYGNEFEGYSTKAEGVLLYDFCIMGYDVEFSYNGKEYYLLNSDVAALSDSHFRERYETFDDPMELVENLKIEGHHLLSITKDIGFNIEPM